MKALTIYQPWASFIIAGIKTMETRPVRTSYRGPLAIHAGKLDYWALRDMLDGDEVWLQHKDAPHRTTHRPLLDALEEICRRHGLPPVACLPRGVVLGIVELTDCGQVSDHGNMLSAEIHWHDKFSRRTYAPAHGSYESVLGDYSIGRFAYALANPAAFGEPLSARGMQGLWEWTEPVEPVDPHGEITAVCGVDE